MSNKSKENMHLYWYSYLTLYNMFKMSLKGIICSYMEHKKLKKQ